MTVPGTPSSDTSTARRPRAHWAGLLGFALLGLLVLAAYTAWLVTPVPLPALATPAGDKAQCMSYAPYRLPGQTPFDPQFVASRRQIEEDLLALSSITQCVRLYSVDQGLDQVPAIARNLGMKVLLGAWIGADPVKNERELTRAIALANQYSDVVRALIVGNEVLLRRELREEELRTLIERAHRESKVPVTYADVWEFWIRHHDLTQVVDFATIHILPFWEDEPVAIDHALAHVSAVMDRAAAALQKPLLIGETGWPSAGRQREVSRPSLINEARYMRGFLALAREKGWQYNLIEAIDQGWKRRLEGTVGGYWGLLDANLQPKFPLNDPGTPSIAEREVLLPVLAGVIFSGLLGLVAAAIARPAGPLPLVAWSLVAALVGGILALQGDHAREAYRDTREWLLLGGVSLLAALLPLLLPTIHRPAEPGDPLGRRILALAGGVRGLLLFCGAVAAVLLLMDPRYRDYPSLLYLTPALAFGILPRLPGLYPSALAPLGLPEKLLCTLIALGGVGRWLMEPANPEGIVWLLVTLTLASAGWRGAGRAAGQTTQKTSG